MRKTVCAVRFHPPAETIVERNKAFDLFYRYAIGCMRSLTARKPLLPTFNANGNELTADVLDSCEM